MNNLVRVTEHFLHTSNEISRILKITIQKYQKTYGNTTKMNNSIRVTEHFLHTSNEISTFLTEISKNLRKYNDFIRKCQYFMCFLLIFHGFRVQRAAGCVRTTRRPKSLQIDHFLNRNLHEFCAFPN